MTQLLHLLHAALLLKRLERRSKLAVVQEIIMRGDIGEAVVEDRDETLIIIPEPRIT